MKRAIVQLKSNGVNLKKSVIEWYWVVSACPYCGKKHMHGAGRELEKVEDFLSFRVAHCYPNIEPKDYRLVESAQSKRSRGIN